MFGVFVFFNQSVNTLQSPATSEVGKFLEFLKCQHLFSIAFCEAAEVMQRFIGLVSTTLKKKKKLPFLVANVIIDYIQFHALSTGALVLYRAIKRKGFPQADSLSSFSFYIWAALHQCCRMWF